MQSKTLGILASSLLLWGTTPTVAQTPIQISQNQEFDSFWQGAGDLVQEQVNLLNSIERSLSGTDPQHSKSTYTRLFLHLGKVDYFLSNQYRIPRLLCSDNNQFSNLSFQQKEVYCTLLQTTPQLQPFLEILEQQAAMQEGINPNRLLSDAYQTAIPNILGNRIIAQAVLIPNPIPETTIINAPQKKPSDLLDNQIPPAIALHPQRESSLQNLRQKLLSIEALFPNSIQFYDPVANRETIDNYSYDVFPQELAIYADLLRQPQTGIAKILPENIYQPQPLPIPNRLEPTVAEKFPFAALTPRSDELSPQLTLAIKDENLTIMMPSLSYGFMISLGEVSLDKIDQELTNIPALSPFQRDFFFRYTPPPELAAIQVEQRRFLYRKEGLGLNPPISAPVFTKLPVRIGETYLMRLIQYQLSEFILNDQPVPRNRRMDIDQILNTSSADVLVALTPVRRNLNGSYTVLWKVVKIFSDPQITDLESYLKLE